MREREGWEVEVGGGGWRRKDRVRKWREKAWQERKFLISVLLASYIHVHTCVHFLH